MNKTNHPRLTPYAQKLRREMTKEERRLWYEFLKDLPVTVNRQKVLGRYIADFYCAAAKLIIEVDGTQHFEDAGLAADQVRDAYFSELGLQVLRYPNNEVNENFEGVCEDILLHLRDHLIRPR